MNQASHYVDLLDWIVGPVESVQAYTGTLARNIEVEDTGVVGIRWRSGALGSLNVTMLAYPKNLEGSITVLGEKGTARLAWWRESTPRSGRLPDGNVRAITTRSGAQQE